MTTTQKQKPSHKPVTVKEIIAGIYGTCPRCGELCYVKPNYDANRPQFKLELERMGERGKYIVDWHDYTGGGPRGGTCYGSNAIPTRLIKALIHQDYKDNGLCVFCEKPKDQWVTDEECVSRKAAVELFEPETQLDVMVEVCHRWTMRPAFHQDRLIRQVQTKEYDRLEQYLSATPLAELHIPTAKNCGNHLTVEEAREIVKIIRTEIVV